MQRWRNIKSPSMIVEAVQVTEENVEQVANWCGGTIIEEIDAQNPDLKYAGINVPTTSGINRASLDSWVVRHHDKFMIAGPLSFQTNYIPLDQSDRQFEGLRVRGVFMDEAFPAEKMPDEDDLDQPYPRRI